MIQFFRVDYKNKGYLLDKFDYGDIGFEFYQKQTGRNGVIKRIMVFNIDTHTRWELISPYCIKYADNIIEKIGEEITKEQMKKELDNHRMIKELHK